MEDNAPVSTKKDVFSSLGEPRNLGREELITTWTFLYQHKAPLPLLEAWIKVLPISYAQILDKKLLYFIWDIDTKARPTVLSRGWESLIVGSNELHFLHVARIRANKLGMSDMTSYKVVLERYKYADISFTKNGFF
jgi:hypothetical protein